MKKIKTTWNLGLLYRGEDDPQIATDLAVAEGKYDDFAKKYANRTDYLQDQQLLLKALTDFEKLRDFPMAKPYAYFNYRRDLQSNDPVAASKTNLMEQRYREAINKIVFFQVALAKISKEQQVKHLQSKLLGPYRYFLQCIFQQGAHTLSVPQESILNLMGLPAYSLWVQGNSKLVNSQELLWKGKKIPLNSAIDIAYSLSKKDRDALGLLINNCLKDISPFAESEINAVVTTKKIEDGLRQYEKPYSATVLAYQNEDATVENLVSTATKHFSLAHRFYFLKAKMLGLKKLSYWDRNAELAAKKEDISFEQGVKIVTQAFSKFDKEYTDIFESFLRNGQIDVLPKVGKRGGAYCSHHENLPVFVLLNYLPNRNSVMTMAHEMGHAFHSTLSTAAQRPMYQDYSIASAEVASTFFENLAFEELFSSLSKKEQISALHDKLNGTINTIFRQIACFNFEVELHTLIRIQGSLTKEALANLMQKHLESYLGSSFKLTPNDGYSFVYWSHLRMFFYVYSYAFGELVSQGLYESYKQDASFKKKIKQFLSAGGSDSPENIFKAIGINVREADFFTRGLKRVEEDIATLEKLIKELK